MKFDWNWFFACCLFGGGVGGLFIHRLTPLSDISPYIPFLIGTIVMYIWGKYSEVKEFLIGFSFDEEKFQERIKDEVQKAIGKEYFDDESINYRKRSSMESFLEFKEDILPKLQKICEVNYYKNGCETDASSEGFVHNSFDFHFFFELKYHKFSYRTIDNSILVTKKEDSQAKAIVIVKYSGIDWIRENIIAQKEKWL